MPASESLDSAETNQAGAASQLYQGMLQQYRRRRAASEHPWVEFGVGVAMGGAVFPLVAVLLLLVIGSVAAVVTGDFLSSDWLAGAVLVTGLALMGPVIGFFVAGFVAAWILPVLFAVIHCLGVRVRLTPLACFAGGAVGMVISVVTWTFPDSSWLANATASSIATAMGQASCGYFVMRHQWLVSLGQRPERDWARNVSAEPVRFSLWQMLVLSTLVSLLLAVLQMLGLLTSLLLIVVLAWLLLQFIPLWVVTRIIDHLYNRTVSRVISPETNGST